MGLTLLLWNRLEHIGKTYKVIVDGLREESDMLMQGRTYFQGPEIDGVVYINDGDAQPGEFVNVKVTDSHDYDLVAHII